MHIMNKNEWRISSVAIQVEMDRIAGLLQKSVQSRTTAPHALRQRHEIEAAQKLALDLTSELGHKR
jgi:hypothetical protein